MIALILSFVLLIGCEEDSSPAGPSPYIGGSQGLIVEFEPMGVEEGGLYTIFEDESFPIQLLVKNKGEYDLKAGEATVNIYGIQLQEYSGVSSGVLSNTAKIEKVSELNDEGGEEIINFGQEAKYNREVPGTFYDVNVFASFTYKYETYASVQKVCFKENLRDDRVCDIEETKKLYSSGGPIQVESVRERPAGAGLIQLEFEVENNGGGKSTIPGQEFSTQYNQIAYVLEPAAERDKWTCTSSGRENQARLVDGKGTIKCRLRIPLEDEVLYTKQIGLTLSYQYRDIIQETVRIKKVI